MIIDKIRLLDNEIFESKVANKYLGDQRTLRIGNIISFKCPVKLDLIDYSSYTKTKYISDDSINFIIEIPDISSYAGVCFQKMFIVNVANILSAHIKSDIDIINNDIIIKKEHTNAGIVQSNGVVSLNHIKNINGTILMYLGLYNNAGKSSIPRAISLNLNNDDVLSIMDKINEGFYHLANSVTLNVSKM